MTTATDSLFQRVVRIGDEYGIDGPGALKKTPDDVAGAFYRDPLASIEYMMHEIAHWVTLKGPPRTNCGPSGRPGGKASISLEPQKRREPQEDGLRQGLIFESFATILGVFYPGA